MHVVPFRPLPFAQDKQSPFAELQVIQAELQFRQAPMPSEKFPDEHWLHEPLLGSNPGEQAVQTPVVALHWVQLVQFEQPVPLAVGLNVLFEHGWHALLESVKFPGLHARTAEVPEEGWLASLCFVE